MNLHASVTGKSATAGGWEPALHGDDAERALEWAVRLADTLRWAPGSTVDASLAAGAAGLAVTFACLAPTLGDRRYGDSGERFLRLAGDPARGDRGLGLYDGVAGTAWAESFVGRLRGAPPVTADDVDELLRQRLSTPWTGPLGLARGLIGVGVYALDDSDADPALLDLVLERLAEARAPGRCRDLGMADGLSGLVAFAALVAAAGRGDALLIEAMGAMLAHATEAGGGDDEPATWCHGDVGIAAALALAGPFVSHPLVPQTLSRVLQRVPVDPAASALEAMGLGHGTAGVAHVLHRVAVATGHARAWEATGAWARTLLQRLDAGERCGQPGLLEGSAGVVLVLLSLACDVAPAWDRMLLLS